MSDERVERVRDAIFRTYALNRWSVIGVSWTHANKHGGFARKDIDAIDDYARAAVAALDEEPTLEDVLRDALREPYWGLRLSMGRRRRWIASICDEATHFEDQILISEGTGPTIDKAIRAAVQHAKEQG